MMIEICGVGFKNKGAELMLHAILQRISKEQPEAQFVMTPIGSSRPYSERAKLGLFQKLWFPKYGVLFHKLLGKMPKHLRERYGLVLDSEVNFVLDASGFAYSDQMGDAKSILLAQSIKRWSRQGTKVVLLPQAFGPFSSPAIKDAVKVIADHANLVFAREKRSYDYLKEVVGERKNIKIAPDFTNLVEGTVPKNFAQKNRFCIIPNHKMIDSTSPIMSVAYVPFLISCVKLLKSKGENPFVLVHCKDDFDLAELIAKGLNEKIEIINESDPLIIKGILGVCKGVIGSRFHGLVSALSQGVPSLATGWSHKYQMLFEDYGFGEGLIDPTASEEEIRTKIDAITDPESNHTIRGKIKANSEQLKKCSEAMWKEIVYLISS
jgi:polysaccharide pyruvyl transferase WcaK-like protein